MLAGFRGFMRREAATVKREKELGYHIDPALKEKVGKARLRDLQLKYQLFDVDKSGMINAEELGDVLRAVGMNPTAQHVTDLLKQYDYDNSGTLSFAEFVALWSEELQDVESDDKMFKRAFEFFDKDGNGNITLSEFKEVLTDLGDPLKDEECELFFKLVDKDGDGMLNFNEFLGFLKGEREGPGSNESSPGPSPGK